jgi:DNA-binding NarL/FixJ family response regulator
MSAESVAKVVLVDDHKLFRKGMVELINGFKGYEVIWEANNGKDMIGKLTFSQKPDIALLDINMPEMDGYETAGWLKEHHPDVKVLALSMNDNEDSIIRMIRAGAKGYILKDAEPAELRLALHDLSTKGFFYTELVSGTLVNSLNRGVEVGKAPAAALSDRELEFLKLACSELTYKEIADQMCLATRTIDGYREALFEKLHVRSRTGLALYAVKHGLVEI